MRNDEVRGICLYSDSPENTVLRMAGKSVGIGFVQINLTD